MALSFEAKGSFINVSPCQKLSSVIGTQRSLWHGVAFARWCLPVLGRWVGAVGLGSNMSSRPTPKVANAERMRRWARIVLALMLCALLPVRLSYAEAVQLPADMQAALIAKVAGFDRNFAARAKGKALVLLVGVPGDPESTRAALALKGALSRLPEVGGLPHQEELVSFTTTPALAELVRSTRAAIVYFGPGFDQHLSAIRDEFAALDVLTVGAVPDYVPGGVVLGFDLVSGRPKLLINLGQARKQRVVFPASVLNLMKVHS